MPGLDIETGEPFHLLTLHSTLLRTSICVFLLGFMGFQIASTHSHWSMCLLGIRPIRSTYIGSGRSRAMWIGNRSQMEGYLRSIRINVSERAGRDSHLVCRWSFFIECKDQSRDPLQLMMCSQSRASIKVIKGGHVNSQDEKSYYPKCGWVLRYKKTNVILRSSMEHLSIFPI